MKKITLVFLALLSACTSVRTIQVTALAPVPVSIEVDDVTVCDYTPCTFTVKCAKKRGLPGLRSDILRDTYELKATLIEPEKGYNRRQVKTIDACQILDKTAHVQFSMRGEFSSFYR